MLLFINSSIIHSYSRSALISVAHLTDAVIVHHQKKSSKISSVTVDDEHNIFCKNDNNARSDSKDMEMLESFSHLQGKKIRSVVDVGDGFYASTQQPQAIYFISLDRRVHLAYQLCMSDLPTSLAYNDLTGHIYFGSISGMNETQ